MPLYEYECSGCHERFELLVRGGEKPACPNCGSVTLDKLISAPAAPQIRSNSHAACGTTRGERPCDTSGGGGGCHGCPCSLG